MSTLSAGDKSLLEMLFDMKTGYVGNFSNTSFQRFVIETVDIDPYGSPGYEVYSSKANKLRQLIADEPDHKIGALIIALLDKLENDNFSNSREPYPENIQKRIDALRITAQKMQGSVISIQLPKAPTQEDTWSVLSNDITLALQRNEPELVLDRLHTFASKYMRTLCSANGISVIAANGDYYPLHSLAGMLKNAYKNSAFIASEFAVEAIQNSIMLFDRFNAIRNNQSYAHDNEVLGKAEADFVVRAMANVITFISQVEDHRIREMRKAQEPTCDDLPF